MIRKLSSLGIIASAFFTAFCVTAAMAAEISTVRIINKTGVANISVFYKKDELTEAVKIEPADQEWLHSISHDFEGWNVKPRIIVEFPGDADGAWPIKYEPMTVGLPLNIKKTKPITIEIPLHLFRSISSKEMNRLEHLQREDQIYEKLFISSQIAKHFLSKLSAQDNYTRRAVQMWYDAVFRLVKDKGHQIQMDRDVLETALLSFESHDDKTQYFRRNHGDLKSVFWLDLTQEFPKLIRENKCDLAAQLVDHVAAKHAQFPDLATYRLGSKDPTSFINEHRELLSQSCTS